jgi:hypothetical protein
LNCRLEKRVIGEPRLAIFAGTQLDEAIANTRKAQI